MNTNKLTEQFLENGGKIVKIPTGKNNMKKLKQLQKKKKDKVNYDVKRCNSVASDLIEKICNENNIKYKGINKFFCKTNNKTYILCNYIPEKKLSIEIVDREKPRTGALIMDHNIMQSYGVNVVRIFYKDVEDVSFRSKVEQIVQI